jgi:ribonuclease HII
MAAAATATAPAHLHVRHTADDTLEIGIDEAGRGCFWGPMMAGAVVWPPETSWTAEHRALMPMIRDSKKIAPKKRERIAADIERLSQAWGVGVVEAAELDEKGVTWANQEAFRRAIADAIAKGAVAAATAKGAVATALVTAPDTPVRLLIDGELSIDGWDGEQHTIVDGDASYLSIAAASILAKVHHDKWVQAYCDSNAECAERYGLRTGKGYGTQVHRDGLQVHGAHALHRRTFIGRYVPESQSLPRPNVEIKGYRRNYFTLKTIPQPTEDTKRGGEGGGSAVAREGAAGGGTGAGAGVTNNASSVPDRCIIRL